MSVLLPSTLPAAPDGARPLDLSEVTNTRRRKTSVRFQVKVGEAIDSIAETNGLNAVRIVETMILHAGDTFAPTDAERRYARGETESLESAPRSIAMDRSIVAIADRVAAAAGFANRSEAVRAIVARGLSTLVQN